MRTTRPIRGAARVRAITTLAGLALTSATLAGAQPFTRWIGPVSGNFFDAANWEGGILPSQTIDAIIDAVGAPYFIAAPTGSHPLVRRITLDSPDATIQMGSVSGFGWLVETLDINRGATEVNRSVLRLSAAATLRIGGESRLSVLEAGATDATRGYFAITGGRATVLNEGRVHLGRNTRTELTGSTTSTPRSTLHNTATGTLSAEAVHSILAAEIINEGVMEFSGRPTNASGVLGQTILGANSTVSPMLTNLTHSGSIRLTDADVRVIGNFVTTGQTEIDDLSALTIRSAGSAATAMLFNPGAAFTGGGRLTLEAQNAIGHIQAANELIFSGQLVGSISNQGSTTLRGLNNSIFTGELISLDSGGLLDLTSVSHIHIAGDLTAAAGLRMGETVLRVGGDAALSGMLRFQFGSIEVDGDLSLTSISPDSFGGSLSVAGNLSSPSDLLVNTRMSVQGDAVIDGSVSVNRYTVHGASVIRGNLISQNAATLNHGSVIDGAVTAPGLDINGDVSIGSLRINLGGMSLNGHLTITDDTQPLELLRSRLTLTGQPDDGPNRITGDVVLTQPVLFFSPSFQTAVRLHDNFAHTLVVEGHMSVEGRLAVTFFGGVTGAYLGQSFTLIHATEGLAGQFDPLSLPSLANGLSLELVYDSHSLTLRVIPAPATAALLALAGLAATRRRAR